ncbi:MAG: AcrR family transcriptional regulator [Cyclobacteriaceae bacterium]|jgi:AcrR family transcriptional regulator
MFLMKTKDKIIEAAKRLYNEKGLSNVTSRNIAAHIKISHGNLEYHFPNKEALLLAIYDKMRSEVSGFYEGQDQDITNPIEHLHKILIRLEEFQGKYMFFNLDVLEISRSYTKVNQLLEDTLQIRKFQMEAIFNRFIESKYMEVEFTKGYYQRLQHTIRILITFWKPQEAVLSYFDFNQKGEMVKHVWELLLPHFTDEGKAQYKSVTNSLGTNDLIPAK